MQRESFTTSHNQTMPRQSLSNGQLWKPTRLSPSSSTTSVLLLSMTLCCMEYPFTNLGQLAQLCPPAIFCLLPAFLLLMSLCFPPSSAVSLEAGHSWFYVWKLRDKQARECVSSVIFFSGLPRITILRAKRRRKLGQSCLHFPSMSR